MTTVADAPYEGYGPELLAIPHAVEATFDWTAVPPTVTLTVRADADGTILHTVTRPVPPPEVAEHTYRANLSTKTTDMITAVDLARATIENTAFPGASELKAALNRLKRAVIALDRELSATDPGA